MIIVVLILSWYRLPGLQSMNDSQFMNGSMINKGSIVAKSELLTTNFYEQLFIYN